MMIAVNLRPGSKRGRAAPAARLSLDALRALGSRLKNPLPLLAVVAWVVVVGYLGWAWLGSASHLSQVEARLEEVRGEHQRYEALIAAKRREASARDSVLAQITAIREVDGDRYVWAHVLDEVARALAPFTWLVDVSALAPELAPADTAAARPPVEVQITGRTVDIQGYTRFMRQLEDSPWLGNVMAVSAATVVEQGRAVTAFVVKATFTPADSSYVRTAPVAESVVR